jgi:hypothetical protein
MFLTFSIGWASRILLAGDDAAADWILVDRMLVDRILVDWILAMRCAVMAASGVGKAR